MIPKKKQTKIETHLLREMNHGHYTTYVSSVLSMTMSYEVHAFRVLSSGVWFSYVAILLSSL